MDTRWRKFRYGTEEQNPSWSFFGALICPECAILLFALAFIRGDIVCLAAGFWSVIFSIGSLVHLGRLMGNDKEHIFSCRLLDGTWPDLILSVFLVFLVWNWRYLWRHFSYLVDDLFMNYWLWEDFLLRLFWIWFVTETMILSVVLLYMSVMRHIAHKKLCRKLFFCQMGTWADRKIESCQERWDAYRLRCAQSKEPEKRFRRRLLWPRHVQGACFLAGCTYLAALYVELEEPMVIVILIGTALYLFDLWIICGTSRDLGIILDKIHQIAEDSDTKEAVLKPYSVLRAAEEELLTVQDHKRESMEKRIQSERMKVDLITNVSHDLKTPLTSMIGCIDLLKQVKELPEEAKDYVALLSKKAGRLREMIQDVFDMAKATSGGQDLQMERLDMARLIRQTIADMQDRIEQSGLTFRVRIDEGELYFQGDGRKMYRVYQNLIENTLKYSMAGSRVYIEVRSRKGEIRTLIRNTSACEMEFDAEEIMERFTRGDKSRSTEGNGLGIAIARSFTMACGGSFQVTLDGDLFKVETVFAATGAPAPDMRSEPCRSSDEKI